MSQLDPNDPATRALLSAITGQYSVEREVGRGGMGIVYLGVDEQLERPVAIKTLPPHLAADPRVRGRFLREARTAGALSHPNIVPIYAAAERNGVVYFAMRYINGESLAERIARVGTLPAGEVVSLLRQLASALAYAHANGVVHRDIKAENVLLDSETGRAMLTDFGIARLAETQSLTATGTVLGTVQYMSPEQVTGEELDGRSDLYSLGVLAFLCLCGRFPFERPTASAIVVAHVTTAPPKICSLAPGVPSALGDIVDRLLAKSPADRYENGSALRAALDAIPADAIGTAVATGSSRYIARALPVASAGDRGATPRMLMPLGAGEPQFNENDSVLNSPDSEQAMSTADAEQVWARAAQLQANTGMIVPPSSFQLQASTDTVGFNADVVRASAVEAGIDARYVDRAMAERSRAAAQMRATSENALPVTISNASSTLPNWFLGASTRIELETAFDGELDEVGFEEVADEIRRGLGEMVTVSAVGRTLTVTSAGGGGGRHSGTRRVQMYLTSRNGRTVIRAYEDLKQSAIATFMGFTMGGGFGFGGALGGALAGSTGTPGLVVVGMGTMVLAGFGIARLIFTRTARGRDHQLRTVLQRVSARAQELIAERSLPSTNTSRRLPGR